MTADTPDTTETPLAKSYPDVLGTITRGQRYQLEVLQVAVAARPAAIAAGKPFDALVLLQNTLDADVDALVNLILPEKDLGGHAGNLTSNSLKPVRIGLRPGEVGYVNLPVLTTHQTKPSQGYSLQMEIGIEYKQKDAARVRDASGGTSYVPSDKIGPQITALQQLHFSVEANVTRPSGFRAAIGVAAQSKVRMTINFEVLPPAVSALGIELKADYVSLWTTADYQATTILDVPSPDLSFMDDAPFVDTGDPFAGQSVPDRATLLDALKRDNVFFALLKFTQYAFESAHYRLWAGECILITKLLTHVLESGESSSSSDLKWVNQLDQLLNQNSPLVHGQDIEGLLTDGLYTELIYDAAMAGFPLLAEASGENFGTTDEMSEYAGGIVTSLAGSGEPIDLIHAYLPLTLAGLLINDQIAMPGESAAETLTLFRRALDKRATEYSDETQFIFNMAQHLLNA